MNEVVFVCNWFAALVTGLGSRFAFSQVGWIIFHGNVQIAILTILGFGVTFFLMSGNFAGFKLFLTVFARFHFMEFLLMLLLEVDVVHFSTFGAFLDVSSAVSKMGSNFGFRERFMAIVAGLCWLLIHGFK
jgi:hypothetical protein